MTKVESLQHEISRLSASELSEFLRWLEEFDAARWDRQFETDACGSRLDALGAEALEEHRLGRTSEH